MCRRHVAPVITMATPTAPATIEGWLRSDELADDHAGRTAELIITTPPRYGTDQVLSDRRGLHRPDPRHGRTGRFAPQGVEEGRRSSGPINIKFPV